ncbi:hypothetical protein KUTeg_001850 [Tegillarca granosa]|uniref:Methyltransferase FkbM domain-containing protein n=1 Tax=Tegillarca granosa TaxID=220873 RepID=A0ABQ9FX16_TEGGR|nr:hypothetical protein KUTeg_001850 [Tegillarca granosa]
MLDGQLLEDKLSGSKTDMNGGSFVNPKHESQFSPAVMKFGGKVIRKQNGNWNLLDNVCETKDDYILSYLKKPNVIPIYVYPSNVDAIISNAVRKSGGYEIGYMTMIYDLMKKNPDATFVDIGANIGVFSLTAASAGNPVISVDCIKANVYRVCAAMKKANFMDRVTVVHNAVSDKHENVTLIRTKENVGGTFIKNYEPSLKTSYQTNETINTILLEEILEIAPLKSVILKIDAEGAEADILAGGENFFKKVFVKYLLLEVLFQRNKPGGQFIFDFLKRHNMEIIYPRAGKEEESCRLQIAYPF